MEKHLSVFTFSPLLLAAFGWLSICGLPFADGVTRLAGEIGNAAAIMKMKIFILTILLLAPLAEMQAEDRTADICVYGGTSSGLLAAIAAAKSGRHVLVVEPSRWLGGMTGGGIRVGRDCVYPEDIGTLTKMMLKEDSNLGISNPHHGQAQLRDVWQRLMKEHGIEVLYEHRLKAVQKEGKRIVGIDLEKAPTEKDGCPAAQALPGADTRIAAKVFIDASYEGDLMAKAGVRYAIGRESAHQYGESLGGIRPIKPGQTVEVDPYVKPGDPSSGLLPMISPEPPGNAGDASRHFIAFNFRLNGEDEPIRPPDHFKPENYELLRRIQAAGGKIGWPSDNFNRQTIISGGLLGLQADYPDADWPTRARIWREFIEHVKSLSQITGKPALLNHEDYPDTGGFPHQLYVRMGRRMLGPYIMTQADVECKTQAEDSIGLGYYWVDIYPCRVVALSDGKHVATEGEMFEKIAPHPYRIPYRAITPKEDECTNLLVPVCMSASHVAMASIRMEPTYMIMGESAGIAAVQALEQNVAVQDIDPQRYRKALLDAGQVLEWKGQWDSREEWNKSKPGFDWLFPWIDKNKDGKISESEFLEFRDFKQKNRDWENLIKEDLGNK